MKKLIGLILSFFLCCALTCIGCFKDTPILACLSAIASAVLGSVISIIFEIFNIEKVTEQEVTEQLEPLRRAVQLVKRYRDIFCEKNNTEPVRSIVICTMMGSISSFTGNTLQIIENFCNYVNGLIAESNGEPFIVKNPVVDEVLTEKWKEGSNYQDFVSMMKSLTDDVNVLKTLSTNSDINALAKEMFGEAITNLVLTNYAKKLSETRAAGKLNIDPNGVLTTHATGIPVRKNTFYGSGLVKE